MNRRLSWMAWMALAAMIVVGCGDGGSNPDADAVEVFHWWTSGGEAAAMDEVLAAFKAARPETEVVNATIAGGGGSAARPILQTRLVGGNPPDTWQTHHGAELQGQYIAPGFTQSVGDLYREEGWNDVIPSALIEGVSKDGEPHLVVMGVHRNNELWYNKKLLDTHGINIGETMTYDEYFRIADELKSMDIPAFCMGDAGIWATGISFENTLVSVLKADGYRQLWDGRLSFDSAPVRKAMDLYGRMLEYQNTDHAALSWDQAADKMSEAGCAFYSMGDWAYGEFKLNGMQDNVDFGWVSHPESEGIFLLTSDGFTLAKDAPHPEQARDMLRLMGSKEVQEAFNVKKGSICARTDCDRSKFTEYLNWSMDSFARDEIVPTVIHGSAAPADFQQALNDALTTFVVDRNVDAFAKALARDAKASGFGK